MEWLINQFSLQLEFCMDKDESHTGFSADSSPSWDSTGHSSIGTASGQRDRSHCISHLHWVEQLNQHNVVVQSLVVVAEVKRSKGNFRHAVHDMFRVSL